MDIPCNLFGGLVPDITGTSEEVEKIVDTIGIGEMVMIKYNADQTEGIGRMRSEVGYGSDSDSSCSREKGCCTMV